MPVSKREFLIGGAVVAGSGALWALEKQYHWLFSPSTYSSCLDETDTPNNGDVFEFSAGPNTALLEPSVFLTNDLLVVAANAGKIDNKGQLDSPLPVQTWITDLATHKTHPEPIEPKNTADKLWGSDPVIAYIPQINQAALITIAIEEDKKYPTTDRTLYLVSSLLDLNTKIWKSHQKIDLSPLPKNPDKPWLHWDTHDNRGYLVCHSDGRIEIFTCDQNFKFDHELSLKIPDKSFHALPLAFPTDGGIEIIFASFEEEQSHIRVEHMFYDFKTKTTKDPEKIFPVIYPNPFVRRFFEIQLDKNLGAVVTPQRAICLTSATDNSVLVAYKPYQKSNWQTLKIPVKDSKTGIELQSIKSINPQMVGPDTVAVTFLAYQESNYDKNYAYSLLLDQTEDGLMPRETPTRGPYPCKPYPSEIELGDYSQVLVSGNKTAFVSLLDHKLRVKVVPQLR